MNRFVVLIEEVGWMGDPIIVPRPIGTERSIDDLYGEVDAFRGMLMSMPVVECGHHHWDLGLTDTVISDYDVLDSGWDRENGGDVCHRPKELIILTLDEWFAGGGHAR